MAEEVWKNVWNLLLRKPALVITDREVLKQIFVKDFNNFTDRFLLGDLQPRIIDKSVFFANGADWKSIRRIMSPTFSSGKLKQLIRYMYLTARRLGENLEQCAVNGVVVDAKKAFGDFSLDIICGTTFGLDTDAKQNFEHPFIKHSKRLMEIQNMLQIMIALAWLFPVLGSLFKMLGIGFFKSSDINFFEKNISALIQERKTRPDTQKNMDFLQLLIDAEVHVSDDFFGEKKLTTEEIVAQGIIFIIAGYETTSTALQFLSYELAKNQEIQMKMVKEVFEVLDDKVEPDYDNCKNLKYMEATINETLRMHPPVHILTRLAVQAIHIRGVLIPAHSVINIPLSNIGRDPEFFADPDSFRPERFLNERQQAITPFTFMPFGQGPRACIGMRLAMMEVKIALVHILRRVRLVGATPDVLDIEDYTGTLVPRIPIKLHVQAVK